MKVVKFGRRAVIVSVLTVGALGGGAAAYAVNVPNPDPCDAQYVPGGTDIQMTNRLRNYMDCRLDRVERDIPSAPVTVTAPAVTVTGPTSTVTGPATTVTETKTVAPDNVPSATAEKRIGTSKVFVHYNTGDSRGGQAHASISKDLMWGDPGSSGATRSVDFMFSDGQQIGDFTVTPTAPSNDPVITIMITNPAGLSTTITVNPPYNN